MEVVWNLINLSNLLKSYERKYHRIPTDWLADITILYQQSALQALIQLSFHSVLLGSYGVCAVVICVCEYADHGDVTVVVALCLYCNNICTTSEDIQFSKWHQWWVFLDKFHCLSSTKRYFCRDRRWKSPLQIHESKWNGSTQNFVGCEGRL